MPYAPQAIANFFIEKSQQTGKKLALLKLIKLIYIAHGWHLGLFGKPLIDEPVRAWRYGPVIESIYHQYKKYKSKQQIKQSEDDIIFYQIPPESDKDIFETLEMVWERYGDCDDIYLSNLTHQKESPWDKVWNNDGKPNHEIPNSIIQQYYEGLYEKLVGE